MLCGKRIKNTKGAGYLFGSLRSCYEETSGRSVQNDCGSVIGMNCYFSNFSLKVFPNTSDIMS